MSESRATDRQSFVFAVRAILRRAHSEAEKVVAGGSQGCHNRAVQPMATRELARIAVPQTYAALRDAVELTIVKGQQAYEVARVRTYSETGRLIHEHVLLFKQRADYGANTIDRLAADVKLHRSVLQRCVQFYQAMPNCATWRNLTWGHFRVLITLEDPAQRRAVANEANRHRWPIVRLEERIRELAPAENGTESSLAARDDPPELLTPRRGTPGLHPLVDRGCGAVVDLGFKLYRALGSGSKLGAGDIVRLGPDGARRAEGATRAELFAYVATVRRVLDGDTLVVALEVAPGTTLEKTLRLRGVDCPELSTAAGRAAKRFVEEFVTAGDEVVLSTTKPDKYDRSLADVFVVGRTGGERPDRSSEEVFLNNALLQNRHAVRYDGGPKDE